MECGAPHAIKAGYEPRKFQIYRGPIRVFRDPAVKDYISDRYNAMQSEMLAKHPEPTIQDILASIRHLIADDESNGRV